MYDEVVVDQNKNRNILDNYFEFAGLEADARKVYEEKNALAVFFVENFYVKGEKMGGGSSYPSVPAMNYTTVIAKPSTRSTLAHELGHLLNLPHAWEWRERFPESSYRDSEDCEEGCNNIMSYCDGRGLIGCETLWPSQVKEIRRWMNSPVRRRAVVGGKKGLIAASAKGGLIHSATPSCVK